MRVEAQPVFILHSRPYRESSALLECLSRDHGRIGLVARGIRREHSRLPRGLLQPLQPLQVGWVGNGELATLTTTDATAAAHALSADRLCSAMYLAELVLRLTARGDPHPAIFAAYAQCLQRLAANEHEAWTLRRFERDLFAELGYALVLDTEADHATALDPDAEYAYHPDSGPLPWRGDPSSIRISGAALLALAGEDEPAASVLGELRRLARAVLRHLLGGGSLNAWNLTPPSRGAGHEVP